MQTDLAKLRDASDSEETTNDQSRRHSISEVKSRRKGKVGQSLSLRSHLSLRSNLSLRGKLSLRCC